jgi:hypothetical protein
MAARKLVARRCSGVTEDGFGPGPGRMPLAHEFTRDQLAGTGESWAAADRLPTVAGTWPPGSPSPWTSCGTDHHPGKAELIVRLTSSRPTTRPAR